GVVEQAVGVHADAVAIPQESVSSPLYSAGTDFGHSDSCKHLVNEGIGVYAAFGRDFLHGTKQHFGGTAGGGNNAHSHFRKPDVALRGRLNSRAMQQNFTAAAQRIAVDRRYNGDLRSFQTNYYFLKLETRSQHLIQIAFVDTHQKELQVETG